MVPFQPSRWSRRLPRIPILVALLLLGLGLPRFLVVCSSPQHASHVEFAHAGACCAHDHDHPVGAAADGGEEVPDERAESAPGDCTHAAFAVDESTPPGRVRVAPMSPAALPVVWATERAPTVAVTTAARPHATGPPRRDRRTALLATTVLRI